MTNLVFQVHQGENGEWRWNLVAGNFRIVASSGETYKNHADCLHGIELVKGSADAEVLDYEHEES